MLLTDLHPQAVLTLRFDVFLTEKEGDEACQVQLGRIFGGIKDHQGGLAGCRGWTEFRRGGMIPGSPRDGTLLQSSLTPSGSCPRTRRNAKSPKAQCYLDFYLRAVARLGGYLDLTSDTPPGTTVIWRGFARLADLI